jgi:hypothetical protein
MTDNQRELWDYEPSARCVFNPDTGTFRIMYLQANLAVDLSGQTKVDVPLSQSHDSAALAWKEAVENVRKRAGV